MKVLELFSGTESFSKVARERGHECFTIDFNKEFDPDLIKDIMGLSLKDIPFKPDIIWASPPCQAFSVARIGKNWNRNYTPKSQKAKDSLILLDKMKSIILELKPRFFFIENPMGMMRKVFEIEKGFINHITYCTYGSEYMKPTDIWTNLISWISKVPCKKGSKCHISAPRGSHKGVENNTLSATQRGMIPKDLCLEIIKACENYNSKEIAKELGLEIMEACEKGYKN